MFMQNNRIIIQNEVKSTELKRGKTCDKASNRPIKRFL